MIKAYGECTGPLGFPMLESEARALDDLLEKHSSDEEFKYRHFVKSDAVEYHINDKREEVSVVTDASIDKDREIVNPKGIDWSSYQKNPVVTLNHNYYQMPVGKSLWQKLVGKSWKAKTLYAPRPSDYPKEKEWMPDVIWHMIKTGFMKAKSIGFLPTPGKIRRPSSEDISKDPTLAGVSCVYDECKVFEYAACYIGSNNNAVVEELSKSFTKVSDELSAILGVDFPEIEPEPQHIKVVGRSLEQYKADVNSQIKSAVRGIKVDSSEIIARLMGKV